MSKPLCPNCNGRGTVPRETPRLPDGSLDPKYVQSKFPALCGACNGSGTVPDKAARLQNIAAAKAADGS